MGRVTWAPEVFNRRARHRQHGDAAQVRHARADQAVVRAAARRKDPLGVPHDRAERRLLDATNIQTTIARHNNDYVINGVKWWSSGAGDPRCKIYIVMGKTDPTTRRATASSRWCSCRPTRRA